MILTYKNRDIEIDDLDYKVGEGTYIGSATYLDTGVDLTDDEIYEVEQENQDLLDDEGYQWAVCAAEDAFEGDR